LERKTTRTPTWPCFRRRETQTKKKKKKEEEEKTKAKAFMKVVDDLCEKRPLHDYL
jgi:hypothetical protein